MNLCIMDNAQKNAHMENARKESMRLLRIRIIAAILVSKISALAENTPKYNSVTISSAFCLDC
jgi:hypothetical protein